MFRAVCRPLTMAPRRVFIILLLGLAGSLALCGRELALPVIPPALRDISDRAAYMLEHYWDNMDFRDSAAVADRDFMGQNFADFMSVMPLADSTARRKAVDVLVHKSAANEFSANELSLLAEGYLLDRKSPVADDDVYLMFADAMIDAAYPRADAIKFIRHMVASCRPGAVAPDFSFTSRNGAVGRLSDLRGREVWLLFYSPDCPDCLAEIDALKRDSLLRAGIAAGDIAVLAVYGGSDESVWRLRQVIPPDWTDAVAPDADSLYPVDVLPRMFRIGADGTVL